MLTTGLLACASLFNADDKHSTTGVYCMACDGMLRLVVVVLYGIALFSFRSDRAVVHCYVCAFVLTPIFVIHQRTNNAL